LLTASGVRGGDGFSPNRPISWDMKGLGRRHLYPSEEPVGKQPLGKKLTGDIFKLRVKQFDPNFPGSLLLSAGHADCDYVRVSEKIATDTTGRNYEGRAAKKALD